jgi:hypothetical protein
VVLEALHKPQFVVYRQLRHSVQCVAVQEQQATITQLKKDFGVMVAQFTARLDEQAMQIQRVSTQLQATKAAPQVVNNNQ